MAESEGRSGRADERSTHRTLDTHLARGVGWTAISKWSAQAVSWTSMLILARLLAPADYGLVGMATVYLGLITMVSEFGVGIAVVTLRDLSVSDVHQLHTCSALFGLLACGLSLLAAFPMAWFFRTPALSPLLMFMSLSFLGGGLRTVPAAVLQRDMDFKTLSLAEAIQSILQAATAVALAWFGFGYWSLGWSAIAGSLFIAIAVNILRPQSLIWPRYASIRPALIFGSHLLVSRLSWYLYSNADFAVAGRMLGASALGAYSLAWNLASMPVDKIADVIARVTPSVFSAAKDNASLRRYLSGITEPLAFVTFPASIGLALVAPDAVLVLLGPKWTEAIVPLQLLSLNAALRSISPILSQIIVARQDTRFGMANSLFALALLPPAFVIGSRWGVSGIACAWLICYPIFTLPLYLRTFWLLKMRLRDYLATVWPALFGVGVMTASVFLLRQWIPEAWPRPGRLALQVVLGGVAYLLTFLAFFRSRLDRYRRLRESLR